MSLQGGIPSTASPYTRGAVVAVLQRLLSVGVTDSEPRVRAAALSLLLREPQFDFYLAANETLQSLCIALNDECFEIRERVISLLGRLSSLNPAFLIPFLRHTLILVYFT